MLTGDRPTGRLHVGHYVGSLRRRVELQNTGEFDDIFIMIADAQALTDNADNPEKVRSNIIEVALDYLACGLDPEKSTLFIQSQIPELCELTFYYMDLVTVSRLQRNPTVKTEIQMRNFETSIPVGFFTYPISQAADITAFRATTVPVGEDQSAHLELTREVVRRFNNFYGEIFPEPQTLLTPSAKMPGTDGRKMSKSYGNALNIADDMDTVWNKLRTMTTDPARERRTDPGTPEKCPVWDIQKFFNKDAEELAEIHEGCMKAGIGCIDCKKKLMLHLGKMMSPIQERRAQFEQKDDDLIQILESGAARARKVAAQTMEDVYTAMGILH